MFMPRKAEIELDQLNREAENEEFEKKFGSVPEAIRKLGSGPQLDIFQSNVKMFDAFKVRFSREIARFGERPKMAVLNQGRHVEIQFVFKNADVVGLVETKAEAEMMERLGVPTKKLNPETQLLDEPVDIMFALDEDADATRKFIRNIVPGGLLLCRGKMAASLLQESSAFKNMGILDKKHGPAHLEKTRRRNFWKQSVKDDPAFKAASEKLPPGSEAVTYREAIAALDAAGRPTVEGSGHVLDDYMDLLDLAMEDEGSIINEDAGTITYKRADMKRAIILKTEPPLGDDVDDNVIFILKKREL